MWTRYRSRKLCVYLGSMLLALGLTAGCQCASDCPLIACARNSEIMLAEGIVTAGGYEVQATPLPDGVMVTCELQVDEEDGEPLLTMFSCDHPHASLHTGRGDAAGRTLPVTGLTIPGHADAAQLVITRDGLHVYTGTAELDHVREGPGASLPACDLEDCRVPVLIAQ